MSTTDMIATPIDEAICWLVMLSRVEPRATSCDVSVFRAEVISGIIVPPMPRPMTNSTGEGCTSSSSSRVTPWVRANMPPTIAASPNGTIRPTGSLSTREPAIGIVIIAPRP